VHVALVVVSDAGWRQENLGSVLCGTILLLDRNQDLYWVVTRIKAVVVWGCMELHILRPIHRGLCHVCWSLEQIYLDIQYLVLILFFVFTALCGASMCKNDFLWFCSINSYYYGFIKFLLTNKCLWNCWMITLIVPLTCWIMKFVSFHHCSVSLLAEVCISSKIYRRLKT
jgi:hypothetical protein